MPKVSVIIPSYNHGQYLRECLDSVLGQTFEDWEIILVDDGSKDDSVEIARSYKDPRIQVYLNERNLGTYGTENRCLDLASGEYVAILNSDDVWRPEKLAKQVALFDANPNASCCYTFGNLLEDGKELSGDDHHWRLPRTPRHNLLPYVLYENRMLASTMMFRRGTVRFDESLRYSGDWVAVIELSRQGEAVYIDEPLILWRQHATNTYKESLKTIGEEIRVKRSLVTEAPKWDAPGVDQAVFEDKLLECAISLHSAYVIVGDRAGASWALAQAAKLSPGNSQVRNRRIASLLPRSVMLRRIWPGADSKPFEESYKTLNKEPVRFR